MSIYLLGLFANSAEPDLTVRMRGVIRIFTVFINMHYIGFPRPRDNLICEHTLSSFALYSKIEVNMTRTVGKTGEHVDEK